MDCEKLIIDLSIGDGYLSIPKSDKANSKLALKHSKKQVEYLLYKQKLLEDHGFKCTYYEYTDKNGYEIVTCTTRCSPIIKEIRTSLYINRVKTLSPKILEKFDMQSLALLFQDDGSREYTKLHRVGGEIYKVKPYINAFVFWICSFSIEELELLKSKLLDLGIDSKISFRGKYPVILITKVKAKERFVEIVKPLLHPSMLYKIDAPVKYHGRE